MQDMKVYILIEDKENETEVRIDGDLETLRGVLHALREDRSLEISRPIENPIPKEAVL
jgi:hypothetical protein